MRKLFLLLACFLLLGATKTAIDVRVKRLEDEIELKRKHVKTKILTVSDKMYIDKGANVYFEWNSGSSQIDFFINGNLVGHINEATGFVND